VAALKRLLLFVEGQGDNAAAPPLISHLLSECSASDCLFLDSAPFMVGNVADLIRGRNPRFERYLGAARKKQSLGGVLVLLDGDVRLPGKEVFCAKGLAYELSEVARRQGAGATFSLASVFAMQEYESWLIGGVEALAGQPLPPDNRPGIRAGTMPPDGNLELRPRDAKGWLKQHMASRSYKVTIDQEPMTRLLVRCLDPLRRRGMRSFQRLEAAVRALVIAIRSGQHIVTPVPPPPPPEDQADNKLE
jgi:hypothetical protein